MICASLCHAGRKRVISVDHARPAGPPARISDITMPEGLGPVRQCGVMQGGEGRPRYRWRIKAQKCHDPIQAVRSRSGVGLLGYGR